MISLLQRVSYLSLKLKTKVPLYFFIPLFAKYEWLYRLKYKKDIRKTPIIFVYTKLGKVIIASGHPHFKQRITHQAAHWRSAKCYMLSLFLSISKVTWKIRRKYKYGGSNTRYVLIFSHIFSDVYIHKSVLIFIWPYILYRRFPFYIRHDGGIHDEFLI